MTLYKSVPCPGLPSFLEMFSTGFGPVTNLFGRGSLSKKRNYMKHIQTKRGLKYPNITLFNATIIQARVRSSQFFHCANIMQMKLEYFEEVSHA